MGENIRGFVSVYGLWSLTFTTTDQQEWAMVFTSEEEALKIVTNDKKDLLTWEVRPVHNTLHVPLEERKS